MSLLDIFTYPPQLHKGTLGFDLTLSDDLAVDGHTLLQTMNLDPGATPPANPVEGDRWWEDGVSNSQTPYEDVVIQDGQELQRPVRNTSGTDIKNGEAVYIVGSSGIKPLVALALADSAATSKVFALATMDIDNGNNGLVVTDGTLRGVQTNGANYGETWSHGDDLYSSATIAGGLTNVMPVAPGEVTPVGHVGDVHASNGTIEVSIGTGTATWNGRYVLRTGDTMEGTLQLLRTVLIPSSIQDITAGGGIVVTNASMRIQGDGGPVDITANPQISAGIDGEYLTVCGASDTNTVTLNDGNGIHLHGDATLKAFDHITFIYNESESEWGEISRSFPASEKAVVYSSPIATTGVFYELGSYDFAGSANDFSPSVNLGVANVLRASHVLFVSGSEPGDEVQITVTGTSITDTGVRTGGDTEIITIPIGTPVNSYFETAKKFNGLVTIETTSGTPISCNYGWCKYWDNSNSVFTVRGLDIKVRGGGNDANANLRLLHHKAEGWTYFVGAAPSPPPAIANMSTDNAPEDQIGDGVNSFWKRTDLLTIVDGAGSEGIMMEYTTTVNKSIELATGHVRITPG